MRRFHLVVIWTCRCVLGQIAWLLPVLFLYFNLLCKSWYPHTGCFCAVGVHLGFLHLSLRPSSFCFSTTTVSSWSVITSLSVCICIYFFILFFLYSKSEILKSTFCQQSTHTDTPNGECLTSDPNNQIQRCQIPSSAVRSTWANGKKDVKLGAHMWDSHILVYFYTCMCNAV